MGGRREGGRREGGRENITTQTGISIGDVLRGRKGKGREGGERKDAGGRPYLYTLL